MIAWRWEPNWVALYDGFIAATAGWNLFGLPVVIVLLMGVDLWRARRAPAAWTGGRPGRAVAVRRLGWTHLVMVVWSASWIVEEIGTYRSMGIFPSNPVSGFAGSLLALLCDVPVGLGLVRMRPWARASGAALALVRVVTHIIWTALQVQYGAVFNLEQWPTLVGSRVLPLLALVLLTLPTTGRLFGPEAEALRAAPPPPTCRDRLLGTLMLGGLVIVVSAATVDLLDWAIRTAAEFSSVGLS